MMEDSSIDRSSLRTTQRAPRSCKSCASRKIKCDKAIPCSRCVKRGEAESCFRETVIVRGQVKIARDSSGQRSYDEIAQENARLRRIVDENAVHPLLAVNTRISSSRIHHNLDEFDKYERLLFESSASTERSPRLNLEDIILPSRKCSNSLIEYDKEWNSWVHYALEYPKFEEEHDTFMNRIDAGTLLADLDPFWLAIYFSVITAAILTMDTDELLALGLPSVDHRQLQLNWFGAAIMFLHRADFMSHFRLETIQTIAILGMSFFNFGNHNLNTTMWACAVSIATSIGLNRDEAEDGTLLRGLSKEGRCRLWWTIVICQWLSGPYPLSQIHEDDFDVPLPSVDVGGCVPGPRGVQIQIHPVQYHIFMARTAIVYNRFRIALRHGRLPLEELVRAADGQLAEVINTLPQHLSPEGIEVDEEDALNSLYPWIRWQRVDVTLVLLHHRLLINRVLQRAWRVESERCGWARSVCLQTAKDILWISQNWELPAAKRSQWAVALNLYVACIFLIDESKHRDLDISIDLRSEIEKCITYMDGTRSRNVIADKACEILKDLVC